MMTLSTTVGYAIQALACLASPKCRNAMIHKVADCANVPAPYLAKIMKKLNDAGIVKSKRGFKGGIWLALPPERISLLEIMNAVDGSDYLNGCLLGLEYCSDNRDCPVHTFWKPTRKMISHELETTTLADVVEFNARRGRKASTAGRRRRAPVAAAP